MKNNTPENPKLPMDGGCACGLVRHRICPERSHRIYPRHSLPQPQQPSPRLRLPSATQNQARQPQYDDDQVVEPESILTPSESGTGQNIARCPQCHVAVWSNYGRAGPFCRFIRVGTLDEAWKVGPDVHIYTRSKRSFVRLDDGVPQFTGFYPGVEEVWCEQSLERWAKIWPEIVKYKEGLV
ncbi:GFA family protein [Aspergillus thermomutatus]|uniref:CENP-V/GFA domain-containing protein n=1 Tax=Aspergillus thermomutatus TaxID=41047 RepID=A0A397G6J6_ASPTH|nr:uncharacterized protein CDV56_104375 [Aspergillus thermomutatus]RHZ45464.1 hypothetical protein CDV56_104375 [Aspergillus thermomutatus]